MPFANQMELAIHFAKHGYKFGANTAQDYERMADEFMFGHMDPVTNECVRPNALDRLRFRGADRHFGVACVNPVFVRTFYPVNVVTVANQGGNNGYFAYECGRARL